MPSVFSGHEVMSACGRKRTLDICEFPLSERPLWRKADVQGSAGKADNLDSELPIPTDRYTPESGRSTDMMLNDRL